MSKIFCTECGHPNLYEVAKPKFCAGCGTSMGAAFGVVTTPAQRAPVKTTKSRLAPAPEPDDGEEFGPEGMVDMDEVTARAEELSQTISAADFSIPDPDPALIGIKAGDILPKDQIREGDDGRLSWVPKATKTSRRKK